MTEPEDWIRTPVEDRYAEGMRLARANREERAHNAGKAVLHYLWPQLRAGRADERPENIPAAAADPRWSVRGEQRTQATYADPHPDDFPGGLPIPDEYPQPLATPPRKV